MPLRLAAALAAAIVAAHAIQGAGAQGGGGMAGDAVAEELRKIRVQMEEVNRRSEALFWESFWFGIGVAVIVMIGTACSVVYLRRQVALLSDDARKRLRPALVRTGCRVEAREVSEGGPYTSHVVFEITNVGAVAAVGVNGRIRFGTGTGIDNVKKVSVMDWSIGALAPNVSDMARMSVGSKGKQGVEEPFWFEVVIDYMGVGGMAFRHRAVGVVRGKDVRVNEEVPGLDPGMRPPLHGQ